MAANDNEQFGKFFAAQTLSSIPVVGGVASNIVTTAMVSPILGAFQAVAEGAQYLANALMRNTYQVNSIQEMSQYRAMIQPPLMALRGNVEQMRAEGTGSILGGLIRNDTDWLDVLNFAQEVRERQNDPEYKRHMETKAAELRMQGAGDNELIDPYTSADPESFVGRQFAKAALEWEEAVQKQDTESIINAQTDMQAAMQAINQMARNSTLPGSFQRYGTLSLNEITDFNKKSQAMTMQLVQGLQDAAWTPASGITDSAQAIGNLTGGAEYGQYGSQAFREAVLDKLDNINFRLEKY